MTDADRTNDYISVREFREAEGTRDWPVLSDGATTFFRTDSFAVAARLVQAIADLESIDDHRPHIDVRLGGMTVRLLTAVHDWWGMSRRDVELARRISAVAAELGLSADPTVVQSVDPIVIGAVDIKKVLPFWQALMGYEPRADSPDEDLVDPRGRGPGIWFEQVDGPRAGRNRMHVAMWDLRSPVSGQVIDVNRGLDMNPELLNSDPYGAGWIVRLRAQDATELDELLDALAYRTFVRAEGH